MTLLKFSDVSLAFGAMPLLDKVSWQIARGERVCIIGRNGTGKSSMMKLVKGDQKPDDGSVWRAPGLKINPAKIDGGGPNNVVPDHAVLRVNLRPTTPADQDHAQRLIDELVASVVAKHDVAIHVHGGFGRPPKPMTPEARRLFELVRDCGRDLGQQPASRTNGRGVAEDPIERFL